MLVATGPIPLSRTTVFYDFDALPADRGRSEMIIRFAILRACQGTTASRDWFDGAIV